MIAVVVLSGLLQARKLAGPDVPCATGIFEICRGAAYLTYPVAHMATGKDMKLRVSFPTDWLVSVPWLMTIKKRPNNQVRLS